MKNPTILKGELSLLRADKSAVLIELRKSGKRLKESEEDFNKLEIKREGVRTAILEEVARLEILDSRAILVREETKVLTQDLKNKENQNDIFDQRSSQERKLHLGRIKELKKEEAETTESIGRLKNLFDKNSKVYNEAESDRKIKLRHLNTTIEKTEAELSKVTEELSKAKAEDKKITKDRLKREDKIRLREKNLEAKETSLEKREEDLITMSKDMTIVYGRLRELYSEVNPKVDLDKIIIQAL